MAKRQAQVEVTLLDRASAGLRRLGGVAAGLARSFGLVTAAATAISTIVGARFLSGAISSVGEFSEAMSAVRAVTGASAEEFNALRAAADEAGTTTRFTATEAAQGLEELARGGQSATEAIESLNPVLALATANNQTVAESAQQVITTLNQFGLAAGESGRVADVFTAAAQRSAQTTAQLARAFQQAGPVAAQANLTIEQTSAIIGRLADAGFRGERGGTALRNALTQLSDPASRFSRELDALGITTDDFVEVLAQLEAKGEDANQAIRALGLESAPAIQALVSSGSAGLNTLVGQLNQASGAASNAATVMENNLPGALRSLRSAYDSARRSLVEPLVGRITQEVQGLTERIREFVSSGQVTQFAELLRDGFETALTAAKNFIGGINFDEARERIESFVTDSRTRLGEFRDASASLATGFDRLVGGVQLTVGVLSSAFNGLGVAIGTAVGLATKSVERFLAIVDFFTAGQIEFIRRARDELDLTAQSFQETTDGFSIALGDALGKTEEGWNRLVASFNQGGAEVQTALDGVANSIDQNISDPAATAEENLQALKAAMVEAGFDARLFGEEAAAAGEQVEGLGLAFEKVTGDFGNGIETRIIPTLQQLGDEAEASGERVDDALSGAADGFERTTESANRTTSSVDAVTQASEKAGASASGMASSIAGLLGGLRSISDGANEAVEAWLARLPTLQTVEGFFARLARFSAQLTQEFERQSAAADDVVADYERTGVATAALAQATNLLNAEYNLLDQQRLANLKKVISDAQSQSEQYLDSIIDRNRSLQEEILRVQGREEELAELRDKERKKSIEDQIRDAKIRGDREALTLLQEQLQLENLLAEEKAKQAEQAQQNAQTESDRADQLERAADAAEREARAKNGASDTRTVSEIVVRAIVEQGELQLSEANVARITQRILAELETDRDRT